MSSHPESLVIQPQIQQAISAGEPVVGFETTVLSFGLPYPDNIKVGESCEARAREYGCVPATSGIVNGKIRVGLTPEEFRHFCDQRDDLVKVNMQNIASTLQSGKSGAFTVAATMQVCHLAGIKVMATGGIGGVHKNFSAAHDESSDLLALSRYPVAVVCAGIKSVLDIEATLERLETLGIPVIGYKTKCLPLFYVRESRFPLEHHTDSMEELAGIARHHWQLGGRGILVVTPVPEAHAVNPTLLEDWLEGAHRAAQIGRVTGKAVTPLLLSKLKELSGGRTITANVALLENNATAAAQLARAYCSL